MFRQSLQLFVLFTFCAVNVFSLPPLNPDDRDWLIHNIDLPATIHVDEDSKSIVLNNTLIERRIRIEPNASTYSFSNLSTNEQFIRGVKPEAVVVIDGATYAVGGLTGQPIYNYLIPEWLDEMERDPQAFQYAGYEISVPKERFAWNRKRYSQDLPWPPKGKTLTLKFNSPAEVDALSGIHINVHYEIYDGYPILAKWVTVENESNASITIDKMDVEVLAIVERESEVNRARSVKPRKYQNHIDPNDLKEMTYPRFHVQSDYAFNGMTYKSSDQTTYWVPDPDYETQVNYDRTWPHMLTCRYPYGPGVEVKPGETFESFRVFEMLHDSDETERRGLAIRKLHRVLAPWSTENPILMHVRNSNSDAIRLAVDQCAEVGFEMLILSFGSGINMEDVSPENIARFKADFDYAHSKGIEIGAYSLLSSRNIDAENNVIDPKTGQPGAYFNQAPCLVSEWGLEYFDNLKTFIEETGCDLLEHDGSYPGDPCASHSHPGHKGLEDSQWKQYEKITGFYQWCRERGVYLNVPDVYFLQGANKTAMGYRETNWSLPRELQVIVGRQNIYDGTMLKTPSMGWMFVPLVEYHGGGAAATLEPLSEHLDTYEKILAQNFGSGVQACYRGPRLYDTDETKAVVKRQVEFYKEHRAILNSDIIHVRRPDGRDYDCMLHVNPTLDICGMAMIYNPLNQSITRTIKLPLYYTGLSEKALIEIQDQRSKEYLLDRRYDAEISVTIPAQVHLWVKVYPTNQ